jgi:hypothetical protein
LLIVDSPPTLAPRSLHRATTPLHRAPKALYRAPLTLQSARKPLARAPTPQHRAPKAVALIAYEPSGPMHVGNAPTRMA